MLSQAPSYLEKESKCFTCSWSISIITEMPLTLGAYSQRTWVRHIKGEFLKLYCVPCISAVALGFSALSYECAFLTKFFYFKVYTAQHKGTLLNVR